MLGALDAWNFGFAAFVFGAWGLLLFVFWRFFGFASFLLFFDFCFLFWSFGFASFVFYMTESCAFVKFVFCLLSVVGEERETSLAVVKNLFLWGVLVAWQVSSVSKQRAMDWRS